MHADRRLREAIELLPQGIVFLDKDDRYVLWNRRYAEIYEGSADLLKSGGHFAETLRIGVERGDYPDALGREDEWIAERLALLRDPGEPHEQHLANGRCILIEENKTSDGGTIGLRVDITDLKQREEAHRPLFESNPVALLVHCPVTGLLRAANRAAEAYFGYTPGSLRGRSILELFHPEDRSAAAAVVGRDEGVSENVWRMHRRNGSEVETVLSVRETTYRGRAATIVAVFDITERRRIERRMAYMARHDELTGLANRAHCRTHLNEVLSTIRDSETVTLALVDLDHFKAVNDTYGHHFGDQVLTEAATRMSQLIPEQALLGRIGGDEFAVIFRETTRTQAELAAKAIIAALSEPFDIAGTTIHIGATVGLARAPGDSHDPETLLRYADLALYAAKAEKRGSCRGFHASMDAAAQERNRLEKDFRHAFMHSELEVHYQPLVNLNSGRIECYEALLRWNHPVRGAISPEIFVGIAEDMGLIDQLGRFVLGAACNEAMNWPEDVKLSVNVSPLQFRSGNLLSSVINALSASGLPPERLELEVTEAVLMEKGPRPAAIIRNLRAFGVGISLDDFGTGYSSLSYLLNYPFTKIKIDKSFILNLEQEATSRAVIRAVIGLGRSLGLTVTAEGIEREMERDYLRQEGCTQGQGFLFGKAEPIPSVRRGAQSARTAA